MWKRTINENQCEKLKKKVIKKKSVVGIRTSYLQLETQESNQCARTTKIILQVVWFELNHLFHAEFGKLFLYDGYSIRLADPAQKLINGQNIII